MDTVLEGLMLAAEAGDAGAADQLFTALYEELHRLAKRQLARNGGGVSLGTTTLLHEAYLNIAERSGTRFANRAHFLGYAARAMRGLIIDYSRRQQAQKRGGMFHITGVGDAGVIPASDQGDSPQLEALGQALEELASLDAALAGLVDLHFFCGFSLVEIATMRGVSERTTQRDWRKARLLLQHVLLEDESRLPRE
jgi:RNA polymerase sigma factor (TIGR02999 family)